MLVFISVETPYEALFKLFLQIFNATFHSGLSRIYSLCIFLFHQLSPSFRSTLKRITRLWFSTHLFIGVLPVLQTISHQSPVRRVDQLLKIQA